MTGADLTSTCWGTFIARTGAGCPGGADPGTEGPIASFTGLRRESVVLVVVLVDVLVVLVVLMAVLRRNKRSTRLPLHILTYKSPLDLWIASICSSIVTFFLACAIADSMLLLCPSHCTDSAALISSSPI